MVAQATRSARASPESWLLAMNPRADVLASLER